MEIVSLVTFMFLLMTSCLHGAPFKHASHEGDTNTNSKITSTSDCHKNCSFVITESSLSDAQKEFAKFLSMQKSMLVYVNIDPHSSLTLSPANDQKKQNQMREWQWLMSSNSWYINLPIELDYASFHVTYVGESRIRLKIEAIESDNCCISDTGIEQVRDLLWSDVFSNRSGSLLCNRYFDHQEWKSTFYALTTVWIGYDLLCIAPTIDKSYQEKSHAAASVLIPLFCFFIALYHPLTNKIIANPHTKNHLKEVKHSEGRMKLFDYLKGDKPFGYKRVVLKLFFSNEDKRLIPAIKLCILYYFIYLFFNILPMMLEHYYDAEELEDFNSIYKFGLPVFHWKETCLKYDYQLLLTCLLLLPLTSLANLWNYYEFVKSPDFVIFLKFPIVTDENTSAEKGKLRSYSWSLSENVDCMTAKLKKNNQYLPNTDESEFYSKFIKRFTLLFSFEFWKHIFNLSTKVTKELECSDENSKSSNLKPNELIPKENSESINSKPNEVIPFKNSESSVGCNLPKDFKPIENIKTSNQKPNENISIGNRNSSNPNPNEVTITGKSERSIPKPIEDNKIENSENSNAKPNEVNTIEKIESSNPKPIEDNTIEKSESSNAKPIEDNTIEKSESSNAKPIEDNTIEKSESSNPKPIEDNTIENSENSNAKPNEVNTIEKSESSNPKPNEDNTIEKSESSNAKPIEDITIENSKSSNAKPIEDITIENSESNSDNNYVFSLALAVLFQSNIFDSTSRLTNILEFVFVVVTPSVFFKFFDKDTQEIIDDHKKDIIDHTNDYNSEEQEEEYDKCCECLYDFINFCKSDTKTNKDSQTCCCLKRCTLSCTRTKDGEGEKCGLLYSQNKAKSKYSE
ncbi:unnamed protein product [Mytilus edulis]|uniref:Uncharacterized protein n=1 Tax=Mytilus edulis TaxID=6550 RepID=A0A8S3SJM6_MYTED|nr:unnamed protein product [Mytilus edulis]